MAHDLQTPHPHSTSGVPLGLRCLGAIWAMGAGAAPRLGSLQCCPSQNPGPGTIGPTHSSPAAASAHIGVPSTGMERRCLAQGLGA